MPALLAGLGMLTALSVFVEPWIPSSDPPIIAYDTAHYPHLQVVAGRVIAETDPQLNQAQRAALWREYGLDVQFEWVQAADAFTYHELRLHRWTLPERVGHTLASVWDGLSGQAPPEPLPTRDLPQLIAQLNDDPRLHWAAPDALLLEWDAAAPGKPTAPAEPGPADEPAPPTEDTGGGQEQWQVPEAQAAGGGGRAEPGQPDRLSIPGGYSAALADAQYKALYKVADWEAAVHQAATGSTKDKPLVLPGPFPEFEYYRQAPPTGAEAEWAPELAASAVFMQRCGRVYGTAQAAALAAYATAGTPPLAPVTVCVADTGVLLNHPQLAARLHPNAVDCNYTTYRIAKPGERAGPAVELADREDKQATGLPRPAIRARPASHGTCCAGLLARCTAGFFGTQTSTGGGRAAAVRLLPASLKSDRTVAWTGGHVKTPISAFIRLVYALNKNFPTGQSLPAPAADVQNTGDVRVVTVSASVPKSYFSEAEWRIVANMAGKAAGAIAEDLRTNDRLYVFAAGNEAQPEANKPGDVDYVLCVSAAQAFDGGQAWYSPQFEEGSNVGPDCVSAPGEGLITSTIYHCPNLQYLPDGEFHNSPNWSTPRTSRDWTQETNTFGATSGATPQVAALAALLYAQQPSRHYGDVLALIRASCAGRKLQAPYGESMGLIDYRTALGWGAPAK